MTDISSELTAPTPGSAGAGSKAGTASSGSPQRLIEFVELFYFAYRDFTGEADTVLADFGFGRAHHRVLHFVYRHPGLRVADLLDILKITKQSLARVLKQLVDEGFIVQRAGEADRRERLLFLTAKGSALAEKLIALQVRRISEALASLGDAAAPAARQFLASMIAETQRAQIEKLIGQTADEAIEREGQA
ncbi:MarR family winged helix-turn-helix transcriptional regulator [Leptospira interrogans]